MQCHVSRCMKPPHTNGMIEHTLVLHKAHIMCSSQVTLRPNRSSKIVNSRAEEEHHKIPAHKQYFHNIASSSTHTKLVCPVFYLSLTLIITHQSTKMSLLDPASRIFVVRVIGHSKAIEIIRFSYRQTTFTKEAELYFSMGRKYKLGIRKFH